jgi:damage-control phosphatase, subfamily I
MKTSLDCIPCFVRQALDAARLVSADTTVHERILREVLRWGGEMDIEQPAPVMGQRIHRRLRQITGVQDPYRDVKDHQNRMALALLPELKTKIEAATDPLIMALRLAIAGNVIDMGVNGNVTESDVRESVSQALREPFVGDQNEFCKAVAEAQRILYLADNAGEIAFDRLLIEQLAPARVTVAVRGGPVINDATMADAQAVGLHEIVEVIDNGSDAPGTLLEDCSQEFKQRFAAADLILAKGQGNFETLSDEPDNIVFLFKAKCPVIAEHARVPLGAHVLAWPRGGFADSGD